MGVLKSEVLTWLPGVRIRMSTKNKDEEETSKEGYSRKRIIKEQHHIIQEPRLWCMFVISALGRLRQEDFEFKASLGYIETLCL
jgi:hypothetical protein